MALFRLKTSETELSSANKGVTDTEWRQFAPSRDVTGDNFHNGAIHIRFDIAGDRWWVPKDSYLRFRIRFDEVAAVGAPSTWRNIDLSPVALNMFPIANLFQSMEFRINDTVISRVTDFVPQIDALQHRMSKSKAWMDSVGLCMLNPMADHATRNHYLRTGSASVSNLTFSSSVTNVSPNLSRYVPAAIVAGVNISCTQQLAAGAGGPYCAVLFTINLDLHQYLSVGQFIWLNLGGYNGRAKLINVRTNGFDCDAPGINAVLPGALTQYVGQVRVAIDKGTENKGLPAANCIELIWKPNLSIFKLPHALPLGKYELVLMPHTNPLYKARLLTCPSQLPIEIATGIRNNVLTTLGVSVEVINMFFYCATLRSSPVMNYAYLLDLEECKCQSANFTGGTSFNQEQFTVSPSTYALTLAFQDNRAGDGTGANLRWSATQFKCGLTDDELRLDRFFINYGGMNKPQPDADPQHIEFAGPAAAVDAQEVEYTLQRYFENMIQTRAYYNDGGHETFSEWKERGPYYHFNWPRDGTDRSTRVMINYQFRQPGIPSTAKILLFSHFRQVAKIRIENGNVTDVQVNEY